MPQPFLARTLAAFQDRAQAMADARQLKQEQSAEAARRLRLEAPIARGEDVWREIEAEIERRCASGYERAASLVTDLHAIALEYDDMTGFTLRLHAILARHAKKARFLERLGPLAKGGDLLRVA